MNAPVGVKKNEEIAARNEWRQSKSYRSALSDADADAEALHQSKNAAAMNV